jgi:hypothetical protein
MVGMNAGQPILLQLIRHNVHNLLHAAAVVCPVADDLKAVGQVAVGVREVGLELERGAIALYGLGYVAAVLVHGGEVAVRVRKGGVDLNGAGVALQRPLNAGTRKKSYWE